MNLESRTRRWRSWVINAAVFIVLVVGIRSWQQRDMVAGAPPVLQGTTLAGSLYELPAHPSRPVLVHFWATWCAICRAEQSSIDAIAHDHPDVITVAMQSGKADEVMRHMREQGISFPVLNDANGDIAKAWGVHAVPASFIIAPDGKISFVEVGYTSGMGLRLRLWWAGI